MQQTAEIATGDDLRATFLQVCELVVRHAGRDGAVGNRELAAETATDFSCLSLAHRKAVRCQQAACALDAAVAFAQARTAVVPGEGYRFFGRWGSFGEEVAEGFFVCGRCVCRNSVSSQHFLAKDSARRAWGVPASSFG